MKAIGLWDEFYATQDQYRCLGDGQCRMVYVRRSAMAEERAGRLVSRRGDPATGRAGDWAELAPRRARARASGRPALPPTRPRRRSRPACKGFLERDARVGEAAAVRTLSGRRVEGALLRVDPPPGHSFGEPQPELLAIGPELRALLLRAQEPDDG